MKEVYVCFREWQGDRADNGDYVGHMSVFDNEDKAMAWLKDEVEEEEQTAKDFDNDIVFDKLNGASKSGGSVDYEIARLMLQNNHGVSIRVYDGYQDNYDSYSDIVIEIKQVE